LTASARFSDNFWLYSSEPMRQACPLIDTEVTIFSAPLFMITFLSSEALASGRNADLLKSNSPLALKVTTRAASAALVASATRAVSATFAASAARAASAAAAAVFSALPASTALPCVGDTD